MLLNSFTIAINRSQIALKRTGRKAEVEVTRIDPEGNVCDVRVAGIHDVDQICTEMFAACYMVSVSTLKQYPESNDLRDFRRLVDCMF